MRAASKRKPALERTGSEISSLAADGSENAGKALTRQLRWQSNNPKARWAHLATESAIRKGLLVRPDRCDCCGRPGKVDAHHDDYDRPLKVRWLLRACHMAEHARLRKAGAK